MSRGAGAWFALRLLPALAAAGLAAAQGGPGLGPPGPGLLVQGEARDLVLQRPDLPVAFTMAGDQALPGGDHAVLYFRPEVLAAPSLPDGGLLGVMASALVLSDPDAARHAFTQRGGTTRAEIEIDVRASQPGARVREVQRLEGELPGADLVVAFRLDYDLQGLHVIEYRYRMTVANVLASLMVTGRATESGGEPAGLADQARGLAERQAARLLAARTGPGPPER